jgi:ribosomal protein L32
MTVSYASGPGGETDWYSVLGLGPSASAEEITTAVERMSRQASALANMAPERSQQLREVIRAIKRDLLSGAEARQRYDLTLVRPAPAAAPGPVPPALQTAFPSPPAPPPPAATQGAGLGSRFKRFMQTSWTCPACGEGAMPDDRFCKACGTKIAPPAAAARPAPAPEPSFCGSCGKRLDAHENFCTRCGTRRT